MITNESSNEQLFEPARSSNETKTVYLLGTGGTISSVGHGPLDYTEYGSTGERLPLEELVSRIPAGAGLPRLEIEQLLEVGSPSIGPEHWLQIARRINSIFLDQPEVSGIVVTHGTSTMEESAYFLNLAVNSAKPVVITGSMRPPTAEGFDGLVNLIDAIRIASSPDAIGMGVTTVMNNEIQSARDVTKYNTYRVDTFIGGPFGVLGYVDSDQNVVLYRSPLRRHTYRAEFQTFELESLPRVDVLYAYAGADGTLVEATVRSGVKGIVVAGSGAGGGPPQFMTALEKAIAANVVVVMASHVGSGRVIQTSRRLAQGFLAADDLSPKKARILLMLGLTVTEDTDRLQQMFYQY